jgi:hypothetical protein
MIPAFPGAHDEHSIKFRPVKIIDRIAAGAIRCFAMHSPISYSVCINQAEGYSMNSAPKTSPDKELVKVFEAAGVVDYLEYLQSGKRIMWVNFKAGVAKGLGMTVGLAVVLGVLVWVLTKMVNLPLIGEYFSEAEQYLTEYADSTNYEDEFAEMNRLLAEINENSKVLNEQLEASPDTEPEK